MPRRTNISNDAARMARQAASDLNNLNRALNRAQNSVAGLHRAIKIPNTKPRRHTIKTSRTAPSLLMQMLGGGLGNFLGGGLVSGDFDANSFLPSSGQFAAQIANASLRGQRIL